jgi:hypothetical protein
MVADDTHSPENLLQARLIWVIIFTKFSELPSHKFSKCSHLPMRVGTMDDSQRRISEGNDRAVKAGHLKRTIKTSIFNVL